MKYQTRFDAWIIFILSTLLFIIFLPPEFIAFQTRFALFAKEMLEKGISLFPQSYLGAYPDYPVTPTLIIYAVSKLFSKVTPFTAILPTALASAGILVIIYYIGKLHSRAWGLYAVCIAGLTQFFIESSRSISPDQYIALITALSFYLCYAKDVSAEVMVQTPKEATETRSLPRGAKFILRARRSVSVAPLGEKVMCEEAGFVSSSFVGSRFDKLSDRAREWILPFLFFAGFLCRGPIGLIIPAAVVISYYAISRQFKKLLVTSLVSLVMLAIGMALLIYAAHLEGGENFVKQVLAMQIFNRVPSPSDTGFLFYWTNSFGAYALGYPLAILVIITQWRRWVYPQSSIDYFLRYLMAWLFIILVGMSIPGGKKIRYILAIVPAISLLSAYLFIAENNFLILIKKYFLKFCIALPIMAIMGIAAISLSFQEFYLLWMTLPIIIIFILRRFIQDNSLSKLLLAAVSAIAMQIAIFTPIQYQSENTQPFIHQLETTMKTRPIDSTEIVFYKIGPDQEDIKLIANLKKIINPYFIKTPESLMAYKKFAYFIAQIEDFEKLPKEKFTELFRERIGHRECVVFRAN